MLGKTRSSSSQTLVDVKGEIRAAIADPQLGHDGFETSKVMALIAILLKQQPDLSKNTIPSRKKLIRLMRTCYQFVIKNQAGAEVVWFVDMKKTGRVGKGKAPTKPDVTIWCSDRDFVALAAGEANPQKLYAAGRIKVKGNLDRALKVEHIISHEREKIKLAGEAMSSSAKPRPEGNNFTVSTKDFDRQSKL
ncbi:hypothetical protein CROQUDRAFT_661860 [Cronartium quercuum f. sp. fusiforme G11]|uniref:SCP2 domain-containing protein n=1 Tax=Cronartium quercuum f. sp. fusiforme G11 TaxID=708437 RepID=A0A9P6NFY3_9BASI|nr:hypothetical protein CROQUDRAFT_661860 [Cronartium quercuum f. sp. fusiforme G11]